MKPLAITGAAVAAFLGALLWAAIAYYANYEIGIVAWGIGGAVGIGAVMLGGEGVPMGLICAALTLLSIFTGKMMAVQYQIDDLLSNLNLTSTLT